MSSRYKSAFQARRRPKRKAPRPPTSQPFSANQDAKYPSTENLQSSETTGYHVGEAASSNSKHATCRCESQTQHAQTKSVSYTTTLDNDSAQLATDNPESQDSKASLTFDDSNAELIHASDSSLEWDQTPFDYVVPMDRPMYHERYSFERRESLSLTEQAGAAGRRLIRTISDAGDGIGRALASGSSQTACPGELAKDYLQRAGYGVGNAVKHGTKVVRDGLSLIKEGSRALPALQPRRPRKSRNLG